MTFLGKILKTRGNKGEVIYLPPLGINPSHFQRGKEIILKSEKYQRKEKIEYIKKTKTVFLVKFININTIKDAFQLVGYYLYGSGVEDKEIEVESIIDFKVKDIDNIFRGTVFGIKKFGLNMVLEIKHNDEIIYVPFNDNIVIDIRKEERLIIIDPPEGLLKLNQ